MCGVSIYCYSFLWFFKTHLPDVLMIDSTAFEVNENETL
jgi:hypothetical protein